MTKQQNFGIQTNLKAGGCSDKCINKGAIRSSKDAFGTCWCMCNDGMWSMADSLKKNECSGNVE